MPSLQASLSTAERSTIELSGANSGEKKILYKYCCCKCKQYLFILAVIKKDFNSETALETAHEEAHEILFDLGYSKVKSGYKPDRIN